MAPLREKLAARVQRFLEPGERVEHVFLAQSGPNPNLTFLTFLTLLVTKFRIVAVTDRAIVVLRAGWRQTVPKGVLDRLPRTTQLGPATGALWSRLNLGDGRPTWVHRRFYGDVEAADAQRGSAQPPSGAPAGTA
ncbi:MAG TPA: hypothetical protein VKV23_10570 [Acidimicrobiales bacterium]|nr:hypothetical protein [Acidimicrobiales bacterium]